MYSTHVSPSDVNLMPLSTEFAQVAGCCSHCGIPIHGHHSQVRNHPALNTIQRQNYNCAVVEEPTFPAAAPIPDQPLEHPLPSTPPSREETN
jgi:hypothetical protein